ncbi:isochorismatase family protein [Candidatus Kuenenia sp.]|uniref:isochorismatase family protein n=1 Tax=Candidatus Kuenenia sp. TaxID=2499824 RepID=UPI00321FA54D
MKPKVRSSAERFIKYQRPVRRTFQQVIFDVRLRCPLEAKKEENTYERALLVVDVQNEYFSGLLPITHPQGRLTNILRVMDAAAARNISLVVVLHTFPQPDKPFFQRGTPQWELHSEVQGRLHDLLIDKNLPGSFTGQIAQKIKISTAPESGLHLHADWLNYMDEG